MKSHTIRKKAHDIIFIYVNINLYILLVNSSLNKVCNYNFMNLLEISNRIAYICLEAKRLHVKLSCVNIYDRAMVKNEDSATALKVALDE